MSPKHNGPRIGPRTRRRRAPQRRPETVEEGVAWLRSYAIQLFEREEGREADWPVIAQTIFAAAFSIIDEAGGDPRARSVLRRVEGGVYDRLALNPDDGLPQALGIGPATPSAVVPMPHTHEPHQAL